MKCSAWIMTPGGLVIDTVENLEDPAPGKQYELCVRVRRRTQLGRVLVVFTGQKPAAGWAESRLDTAEAGDTVIINLTLEGNA